MPASLGATGCNAIAPVIHNIVEAAIIAAVVPRRRAAALLSHRAAELLSRRAAALLSAAAAAFPFPQTPNADGANFCAWTRLELRGLPELTAMMSAAIQGKLPMAMTKNLWKHAKHPAQ